MRPSPTSALPEVSYSDLSMIIQICSAVRPRGSLARFIEMRCNMQSFRMRYNASLLQVCF